MKIAVVGVTGLVGEKVLSVLMERGYKDQHQIIPCASDNSVGSFLEGFGFVESVDSALEKKPQVALFCISNSAALELAPRFIEGGAVVIDNSSVFRGREDVPLVLPHVNPDKLKEGVNLIASPNCSTSQLVTALQGVWSRYGIDSLFLSTAQSVSGLGRKGLGVKVWKYDDNVLPTGGGYDSSGFSEEEQKLMREPLKIWGDASILIHAKTKRVGVHTGHVIDVCVKLRADREVSLEEFKDTLSGSEKVFLTHEPMGPKMFMVSGYKGFDGVYVYNVAKDPYQSNLFSFISLADNLRLGAATNVVDIMEYCVRDMQPS